MAGVIPPGGRLEVVFSFDTTGSMYSWLDELRGRIQDMIQRLQADIPGIKISVIAHGDYCDAHTYVTKWIDFSSDVVKLCDFVKNVERTGGGDAPECYELVLRQVRTELSWTPGSRRVLIMIGDNNPHEKGDACNKDNIDWKEETKQLLAHGVTIYGVQCGRYSDADLFYQTISLATQGKHLRLEDFGSLFDTLMAVCYRESPDTAMLASYEKEVRGRCGTQGLAVDIDQIFASLRDEATDASTTSSTPMPSPSTATWGLTSAKTTTSATFPSKTKTVHKVRSPPSVRKTTLSKRSRASGGVDRYKQSELPLLKRENVPENNFSLRSLKWTPWILAMANDGDIPSKEKQRWHKRRGRIGNRLRKVPTLGNVSPSSRVLLELAVQGCGGNKRRHVVFSGFSSRCLKVVGWEMRFLGRKRIQADYVLKKGCKVYIRYCPVGGQSDIMMSIKKNVQRYDYAWRKLRNVRCCSRDVNKGGVQISSSC